MSDYILDLRKIVGHRTILQVGASVIVEDAQGRILTIMLRIRMAIRHRRLQLF